MNPLLLCGRGGGGAIGRTTLRKVWKSLRIFVRHDHLKWSTNARLSKSIWQRYAKLQLPECKAFVTYVWIDGKGKNTRSKTRVMDFVPTTHKECPTWDFDGSSAYFTTQECSDTYMCPIAIYKDPFFGHHHKIVLCETYTSDHKPTKTNHRHECMQTMNLVCDKEVRFGVEQELHLMDVNNRPLGWPIMLGEPAPDGPYYCGVGAHKAYGREIIENHFRCCLYSGIEMNGFNAEVNVAQWEFQTSPTPGVKAADDLWMARYLLQRVAEDFGVSVSYAQRLFPNWNCSHCHFNFSTKQMREENGLKHIEATIKKLEKKHSDHMKIFQKFSGKNPEQLAQKKFSSGVADRSGSVRIPQKVVDQKKGYLEDRRPGANCDPYQVMNAIVRTCFC